MSPIPAGRDDLCEHADASRVPLGHRLRVVTDHDSPKHPTGHMVLPFAGSNGLHNNVLHTLRGNDLLLKSFHAIEGGDYGQVDGTAEAGQHE